MKHKGKEYSDWTQDELLNKTNGSVDRNWFERINYDDLGGIPFVGRPKGGIRFDFYGYNNLQDYSLEIKEANPHRWKHTNDIHRAAHYIGMNILKYLEVTRTGKKSRHPEIDSITQTIEKLDELSFQRGLIRSSIRKLVEMNVAGVIDDEEMEDGCGRILESIKEEKLKDWAERDMGNMFRDGKIIKKEKHKQYMKQYRESNKRAIDYDDDNL